MKKINGLSRHCDSYGMLLYYTYRGVHIDKYNARNYYFSVKEPAEGIFYWGCEKTLKDTCKIIDEILDD